MPKAESRIKASPEEFAAIIELIGRKNSLNLSWLSVEQNQGPAKVSFGTEMRFDDEAGNDEKGPYAVGEIIATKLPIGALLTVWAKDADWCFLEEKWKMLRAEIKRSGYELLPDDGLSYFKPVRQFEYIYPKDAATVFKFVMGGPNKEWNFAFDNDDERMNYEVQLHETVSGDYLYFVWVQVDIVDLTGRNLAKEVDNPDWMVRGETAGYIGINQVEPSKSKVTFIRTT